MAKDKRLYARLDIGFDEHDKIFPLSDAAFRALVEATLYARRQLTDGFLAERLALKKWGADVIEELCTNDSEKPSLVRVEGGWQIHDFAEHQTTNADIQAKREAGARGGRAKARARQNAGKAVAGAREVLEQNGSTTLAKTETETETETVSSKELTTRTREAFETVWLSWPKKTEKKKSLEQFERASKKLGVDLAAAHVRKFGEAYASSTETQYVPALAVWLRNERWTDELPAVLPVRKIKRFNDEPDDWNVRSVEAHGFIQRLEAIDAARGSGEAVGDYQELRQ